MTTRGALAAAALSAGILLGSPAALPYIEAIYPLQQMMAESEVIAEGIVEKTDGTNRVSVVKVGKALKGKCVFEKIRINVGVGRDWHPDALMPHLVAGAPVVVFYKANGEAQVGMVYLNRFFFQLAGDPKVPPDKAWWNFTNIEIRMNRTFHGTVPELSKLVSNILVGKTKPPPPDTRMPPIARQDVTALPVWGATEADEKGLPEPFRRKAPLKPRNPDNPGETSPGIRFEYFEGEWKSLPDFPSLKPVKEGTADRIDLSTRGREDGVAFRFTGFIEVSKDGTYFFHLASDGGSRLLIGDMEVVNNDGSHKLQEVTGGIPLKPGRHAFTLTYFAGSGEHALALSYEGPGVPKQAVPASVLTRPIKP